jgi:hypothetical protein
MRSRASQEPREDLFADKTDDPKHIIGQTGVAETYKHRTGKSVAQQHENFVQRLCVAVRHLTEW